MAGVAGALYVPQVGIINPSEFSPGNSIEAVLWVAVGGRGTLIGRTTPAERERIDRTLETIGLVEQAGRPAGALSHGQKQWLEIGMLLMQDPQLLLVDEPVAGMTQKETEATAELLKSLAGERSVVVVEHDMEFVRSIARRVTVLHEGSVLAEGSMEEIQGNLRVVEVYLGE